MHWKGRGTAPPPPFRAPSLCPATVSLTPSATSMAFVTDSNRPQPLWQPPPTACLIASGAASEVPPLLMHPWLIPPAHGKPVCLRSRSHAHGTPAHTPIPFEAGDEEGKRLQLHVTTQSEGDGHGGYAPAEGVRGWEGHGRRGAEH